MKILYNLLAGDYTIPIIAGVAALIVLLVIIVVVSSVMRKKKKSNNNPKIEQPVETAEATETEQPIMITETALPEQPIKASETALPEQLAQTVEEVNTEQPVKEVEEPVVIEEPVEEPAEINDTDDFSDNEADEDADEAPKRSAMRVDGSIRYIIIKYNKSFTAKLIQSEDEVKNYYSALKNELLSYNGIKSRVSWKGESFYCGRVTYAKLCIRGKCVCLFLPLNAKDYEETKYKVEDMSEIAAYEKIPCLYRIKNDRRLGYASDLIATAMQNRQKIEDYKQKNFAKHYPYEEIEPLIERKLVKVLTEEDAKSGDVFKPRDAVTVSEADELMQDEIAVALIEENEEISDRTKCDIVNIDTLSRYFADGETVTLQEMKKRIPSIPSKTTYIKVLARGKLDKKLVVIADAYSIQAAKMILLTGGNAIKKKNS